MGNEIIKPTSVLYYEFVQNITTVVNDSGLPPYVIEAALTSMLSDVRNAAQKQYTRDFSEYREKIKELERPKK